MTDIRVEPGTIVVFSDIGCPWSHAAIWRLQESRSRLGLAEEVRFDHRAFPLELINRRPTPKLILDAEIVAVGRLAPEAGWKMWRKPPHEYPVTTLLALEAVQAAKRQSLRASERLARALRVGFFRDNRCISLRHEILEIAENVEGIDSERLREDLDHGRARPTVMDQYRVASSDAVKGSPHVFLSDGSDVYNPGVEMHWQGKPGHGLPVIDFYDPSVFDDIVKRAAV